jgi:hypothetical protein
MVIYQKIISEVICMPAGNSPKIESNEKLEQLFNDYLSYCADTSKMPNIAGFCRFCDIHRDTYYNYKENIYIDTIKKIENCLEDETINTKAASDIMKIFYMKNKFGYKDKQEIESRNVNTTLDELKRLSDSELQAQIDNEIKKLVDDEISKRRLKVVND